MYNQGTQYSPLFYDTKEEARKAREAAMDAFDWPPFLTDGYTSDPRKRTKRNYVKDVAFYKAIRDDGVPDPWDIGFGDDYATYENPTHRYHGTSLQNLLANLDSIKDDGLLLRALCDDPATNPDVPHSRCGALGLRDVRRPHAQRRHDQPPREERARCTTRGSRRDPGVAGGRLGEKTHARAARAYSEGPVVPVACLRVACWRASRG